ncbi:MAG: preprotein translocase subunit YajC [Prolixibacteraceae bacterium]
MNTLNFVIAQQQPQQSMLGMFLPLVLIIVVFYFFMIRPQMKRQKETQKFRDALQKGDKVVTSGGIYGRIDEIKDQIIILEVAPNIKLKVDKSVVLKDMSDAPVPAK